MTSQTEQAYYLARIAAERAAARRAANDQVRTIHLELADRYQRILDGKQEPPSPA
jgi:hypothetical protein